MKKQTTLTLLFLLASLNNNASAMGKIKDPIEKPAPKESFARKTFKALGIIACITTCEKNYCCPQFETYASQGQEPLSEFEECFQRCETCCNQKQERFSLKCCSRNIFSSLCKSILCFIECFQNPCGKFYYPHDKDV